MYDIYTMSLEHETCAPDKAKIDLVFPYTVFHFVLSGAGYVGERRITAGNVFICFEETRMAYYPDESDPWTYVYFRVGGREVREAFLDHGFPLGLCVLPFSREDALLEILSLHQHLRGSEDLTVAAVVANAIFLLFDRQRTSRSDTRHARTQAERIRRYIDENYYKAITVADVADRFYLNKNYLRTLFVRYFELSPKQYLQRTRMQRAAYLLENTQESIRLIAVSVGYADPLLFSRIFKQYYSLSPNEYRKTASAAQIGSESICK